MSRLVSSLKSYHKFCGSRQLVNKNIFNSRHSLYKIQKCYKFGIENPHNINYDPEYPEGQEHLHRKIKLRHRLSDDEADMLLTYWGSDKYGIALFALMVIMVAVTAARFPMHLRQSKVDEQILENWVNEHAEELQGTNYEKLIFNYCDPNTEDCQIDELKEDGYNSVV